jgi:hypothetical protein
MGTSTMEDILEGKERKERKEVLASVFIAT